MSGSQYFPPYVTSNNSDSSARNVNLDLTNYATKADLDNITHVDTSSFALKTNLTSLSNEVDKLDIPKITTVPTDLSKLTNEVQKDFIIKNRFYSIRKKSNRQ